LIRAGIEKIQLQEIGKLYFENEIEELTISICNIQPYLFAIRDITVNVIEDFIEN